MLASKKVALQVYHEDRAQLGTADECIICSAAGIETEATRHTADGNSYCDDCAKQAEAYLDDGQRLEGVTKADIDHRIYMEG